MKILFLAALSLCSLGSMIVGVFAWRLPARAIDMQKRFYEKINWRLEPISLAKEMRNTKIMGVIIFTIGLTIAVSLIVPFRQ